MSQYPCKDCLVLSTCIKSCDKIMNENKIIWPIYNFKDLICNFCGSDLIFHKNMIRQHFCSICNAEAKYFESSYNKFKQINIEFDVKYKECL